MTNASEKNQTIESLEKYAQNKNYAFKSNNISNIFVAVPSYPISKTKNLSIQTELATYYCYDSFSTNYGMNKTFCGLYIALDNSENINFSIQKKDSLDWLLTRNKIKTQLDYFDKNLTLTSDSKAKPAQIIQNLDIDLFLTLSKAFEPLKLYAFYTDIHYIKEFNGKIILGLETNRWIIKNKELDLFINIGNKILQQIY